MPARPIRVKLKNELGVPAALPAGEEYLRVFGHGEDVLVLFPGPDLEICRRLLTATARVFLLDVPELTNQMPPAWHKALPAHWERVSLSQAHSLLSQTRVLHYTPASRLFPSIFAPLLARLRLSRKSRHQQTVLLCGAENGLILPELTHAASALGYTPHCLSPTLDAQALASILDTETPVLFLSVNFHGLDAYAEKQALLEAAGVPVAVWCVDNPFHLLTHQKNQLWKNLTLFVTDDWFLAPLHDLGARAIHLPLATSDRFFPAHDSCPQDSGLTFVGRSAFPDQKRFFAASQIPEELDQKAASLPGRTAHFGWWHDQLPDVPLWPGNAARTLGLGAERASGRWRQCCLNHLADKTALNIVGDKTWSRLVPAARLLPPVDYYQSLAGIYRHAAFSLNLTSLLLPHGLTQRHFDVWACGGFLLTDTTPGLHIFPQDLTQDICFKTPEEALERLHDLAPRKAHKEELRQAWQKHILTEHSYEKRLAVIVTESLQQAKGSPAPARG